MRNYLYINLKHWSDRRLRLHFYVKECYGNNEMLNCAADGGLVLVMQFLNNNLTSYDPFKEAHIYQKFPCKEKRNFFPNLSVMIVHHYYSSFIQLRK